MSLGACRVGEVVIGADPVGILVGSGRERACVVARSAGCAGLRVERRGSCRSVGIRAEGGGNDDDQSGGSEKRRDWGGGEGLSARTSSASAVAVWVAVVFESGTCGSARSVGSGLVVAMSSGCGDQRLLLRADRAP